MRLHVNARFVTQPRTGVQRYAHEIASRLAGTELLAPGPPRPEYTGLRVRSTSVIPGHAWEQVELPARLPTGAALWSPAGCGPVAVSRQVVTVHDASVLEHPEWYRRSFVEWHRVVWAMLARRIRGFLTVSEDARGRLSAVLGVDDDRIAAIPLAAGAEFAPVPRADVDEVLRCLGVTRPYVLSFGARIPRKNLAGLLEAWRRAGSQTRDATLVVAGESGLRFARSAGLTAPVRTCFLGAVDPLALPALYSGATLFAFPSLYEGFGLPILESMACGTPVLTSSCTSMPEVAGDGALLVDPADPDSIADGLLRLLDDAPLRACLRARGLARAASYGWDATARRTERALRRWLCDD